MTVLRGNERKLSRNEYVTTVMYYGLGETISFTLQQIANVLGLSRQRIYQIRNRALRKLRHKVRMTGSEEAYWWLTDEETVRAFDEGVLE